MSSLPDETATWTSTRHFQFVAFWDPIAGCDPTIFQSIVVHEWFEDFDGSGGLKVQTLIDLFPTCGRIQFDAHSYVPGLDGVLDELGLVSLVFNTGVDCGPGVITDVLDPGPRGPAPEPAPLILFAAGSLLLYAAYRRHRSQAARRY